MFHQSRRHFFDRSLESKKILVRHAGFFLWGSRRSRRRSCLARALATTASRPSTRLERRSSCGRMSEQKYQSIVMKAFWKGWLPQCSPRFAVSCRRSADESVDAPGRSVRDRGPDSRAHAPAGPVEARRADHAPHHPLYRRGRDGEPAGPAAGRVPSAIDREFFEIFCSVDGVGVRKALRAMVRPVRELARTIQDQDVKLLSTFPGIGEATAERIVAKLRRKVGKFALIVGPEYGRRAAPAMPTERPRTPSPTSFATPTPPSSRLVIPRARPARRSTASWPAKRNSSPWPI